MMRPLQVYLDETELNRFEAWSRARGWTKSQAIRAAIRAVTYEGSSDLLALSGMVQGLPRDASAAVDRYLEETFVAPKGSRTKRGASSRVRR